MQYDPKLKLAIEEIKEVLKKYDAAGIVVLHRPGFSEYLNHVTPSYSCAMVENEMIGFKIASKHYPTLAARTKKVTDTSNMMMHLSKITGNIAMNLLEASMKLDKAVGADHGPGNHSDHITQNN